MLRLYLIGMGELRIVVIAVAVTLEKIPLRAPNRSVFRPRLFVEIVAPLHSPELWAEHLGIFTTINC